jgi:hypothetical protein
MFTPLSLFSRMVTHAAHVETVPELALAKWLKGFDQTMTPQDLAICQEVHTSMITDFFIPHGAKQGDTLGDTAFDMQVADHLRQQQHS